MGTYFTHEYPGLSSNTSVFENIFISVYVRVFFFTILCYRRRKKKREGRGEVAMKSSTVCLGRKAGREGGRGDGWVEVHIKVSYAMFVDGHP